MSTQVKSGADFSRLAGIGGVLYLCIIASGLFAELYVRSGLVVADDMQATVSNLMANEFLFRLGFVSDLFMLLCDLALALVLYQLLKPVSRTLALAAVCTRLAMDCILALNLLNHFLALLLINDSVVTTVFNTAQIQGLLGLVLQAHSVGYSIGLVFFAVHCLVLGYLLFHSRLFPKTLAMLMSFAALSYLVDSFAKFLVAGYATSDYPIIMLPALIAEVSFCLWLLFKGVYVPTHASINRLRTAG
ncbi:MAG: DUF4386 domain-containing protein [Gammaproteobacteria bacterium]|nr:DUF4386 domain-containing protein [Gammaproteobacteria bacterium]MDH5801296.1 DUF4386 domain-containing protein [Gammaproteobacteria bacterium]